MVARIMTISKYVYNTERHNKLVKRLTGSNSKSIMRVELYGLENAITTELFKKGTNYERLDMLQLYLGEIKQMLASL